jgi:hypothetical protein
MIHRVLILLIMITGLAACTTLEQPFTKVTVRDKSFQVIRDIDDPIILANLSEIWSSKRKIAEPSNKAFDFSIDIATPDGGGRWLYSSNGYVTILSKARVPVFQLIDKDTANKILIP